ncbi:type II toxin-antitoxin system HicA family toxin [Methylobacterium sp. EM32]|uniref:type II toxin-antitoxin system HicA family toxin n=1 Tax=Methylobacterium sp. EM32 TaxID=3163481 RepID=UPI0033BE4B3B
MDDRPPSTIWRSQAAFADPIRANIVWQDIGAIILPCGSEVQEGRDSRVRATLSGVRAVFHRPHPQKETDRGAVKSVRRVLLEAGIEP